MEVRRCLILDVPKGLDIQSLECRNRTWTLNSKCPKHTQTSGETHLENSPSTRNTNNTLSGNHQTNQRTQQHLPTSNCTKVVELPSEIALIIMTLPPATIIF